MATQCYLATLFHPMDPLLSWVSGLLLNLLDGEMPDRDDFLEPRCRLMAAKLKTCFKKI